MRRLSVALFAVLAFVAPLRAEQVVISEVMYNPQDTRPEYIELWNITNTPLDFARWHFTDGITYQFLDFNAGTPQEMFLKPGERIVVSSSDPATTRTAYGIPSNIRVYGPWSGALDNSGEKITLADKNGVTVSTLSYKDGGRWPKAADGAGYSLVLRNENNPIDDWHNWRTSLARGGTPGTTEAAQVISVANPEVVAAGTNTIIDLGDTWKYTVPASDPGTDWRGLGFDDNSWSAGPGLLGFTGTPAGVPAPGVQTTLPSGSITYLFRKTFTFNGNPAGATYSIDQVVDDGVAYYLNGQLLGSVRYTPGGAWNAPASTAAPSTLVVETSATTNLSGAASAMVNGTNVLTAEVHNITAGSTDLVFGARFKLNSSASLSINEVKPGNIGQGFVEFFNGTPNPINLSGYYLSDTSSNLTKFQISSNLIVASNSYATIGFAESNLAVGSTTTVYLTQPNGTTVVNALSAAIPLDGRSLGRSGPGSSSWFQYLVPTPGTPNGQTAGVRLSEVHFGGTGHADWVEIENLSAANVLANGLYLTTVNEFTDKVPLNGSIPANGFASFPVDFATDSGGNITLYLIDANNNVLGVAELEHHAGLDSIQAIYPFVPDPVPSWETPKTAPEWYSSATDTKDASNAPLITTSIVINEIMCDPPSDQASGEFVELYNKSGGAISLAGWKLRGGVDFDFPPNASIPAGAYIVIGGDATYLQSAYPGATVLGNWSGTLGNKGDLIRLLDQNGNLADEVDYKVGGDWPDLASGLGSSLELVNPNMDNSRASAWRSSDESNKTSFQSYTINGTYQQLNSLGAVTDYKELHLNLVGDAHCIVRNVAFNGTAVPNRTVLSTTGSSASGWLCQGTHWASFVDATGALHLVSDGHGDNRPNRAEIDYTNLTQGVNYNLTFDARWVSGKPRLIVQTWDHTVGNTIYLPVPNNLGTAGAANSCLNATPLPQVDSVLHSPAVPKSSDSVRVTARVVSATPLASVQVLHRAADLTNSASFVAAPMFDDGTNGDVIAGDGIYTAVIAAHKVNNRIVQFFVRATAQGGAVVELPKNGAGRPAMWIVDDRTIDTQLHRHRFVISPYERDSLNTSSGQSTKFQYDFPRLSNHYVDCTFISDDKDVYYNGEIRKSGSPWTRSDTNELDRGKWKVPFDRLFRGRQKSTFDNDATNSTTRHHNRMMRYWLYVLGQPVNENEFVYNLINSDGIAIREDTEPVDGEMVGRCFPNGNQGQLFRSDDEWWFQDDWNRTNRNADWAYKGTDATIRYHTEFMARSRETDYDYSALIDFFKTVSNASSTPEQLNRDLDPELTLMMAAVRGYAYDWDSLTLNRGKNGYFYRRPTDGRFMFLHWDSDLAFQDATNIIVGTLPGWSTYISKPWTRRILNYYLSEMLKLTSGPNSVRSTAFLDAEEAASAAYTVNKTLYTSWFTNRRPYVEQEINLNVGSGGAGNAYTAPFVVSTAGGTVSTNTISLTGTAPSTAFRIVVVNHPEALFSWTNQTTWQINGLILATGSNTFTLQMLDLWGNVLGTTTYSVTKTGNAPPIMALNIAPASQNAVLGATVTLDASASYDPDGGAVGFTWNTSPTTGFTSSQPTPASMQAVFTAPGVYAFTATGTDPGTASTAITREVTAYSAEDFSSFASSRLEPFWTVLNTEQRDSYSGSSFYSLEDTPNNLVIQVFEDSAKPLAYTGFTHPVLFRPLPAGADFSLQTDLTLEARRSGSFVTGLYLETVESGATVRYAFGFNGGNNLLVRRMTSGGSTDLATPSSAGESAVFRIRRVGTQLRFERRVSGVWNNIFTQNMAAGSTASRGGPFVATGSAERVRVSFDYVLLADPTNTTSVVNSLRITEIMYNPLAPDTVEFIELKNVGSQTINLQGVHFDQGLPFDAFTFGNVSLSPGQYAVVTDNSAAFQARYGFAPLAQWPAGNLSNGGERIVLRDADGNPIHDFSYDDAAPWPLTPDGQGPSLEVIDVNGNYSLGTNWRASFEIGGSPGYQGAGPDTDGDGQPDSWEALFGTNPNNPASRLNPTTTFNASGQPQLTWPTVSGKNYRVDYSNTLSPANWQMLTTVPGTGGNVTYTDTTTPRPASRFYRIVVVP